MFLISMEAKAKQELTFIHVKAHLKMISYYRAHLIISAVRKWDN